MHGASINITKSELTGGRSQLELYKVATRAGSWWGGEAALHVRANPWRTPERWRGLPDRVSAWPEWLWEQWCASNESADYSEAEVFAMHPTFIHAAVCAIEDVGFDCR